MDRHHQSEYKFVTVDAGEEGTFQPVTKSVRSHAIRTAIQRGGSQLGASTALVSQGTMRDKAHLKGRFRLGGTAPKTRKVRNQSRKNTADPLSPDIFELLSEVSPPPWIQRLGSDSADPFNTLPIPSSPSVDALVKYFTTRFNLNATTTDTQRPWFPYAMQSALIMRATLALAAEFLTATMPSPDPELQREGYQQKGEAMRIVRARLESRESAQRANDDLSVLAGVAMLGSVEAFQGRFSAANVHLTGLHAMITARGGPDTIRHDYILCRSINWIDIQVASGLGRVPKFPMFHTLDQVRLPPSVVSRAGSAALRHHLDRLAGHSPGESAEPRRIFTVLRQAVWCGAAGVAADEVRIVMNTADSTMLHFLYAERRRAASPVQKRFLVLVWAAQVFLYAALREIPTTGHMVRILVARMRAALDEADAIALIWVPHDGALLWVLFVGVVGSAAGSQDRAWFLGRLRRVLERARDALPPGRRRREDLQRLLAGFLWRDKYCLPVLDEIWASWERGVT
ncbi:hypothetical protein CTA2_6959 [Colletotrichum tanaceti]|nr:hypothetical protein CTA2_6959 [Colletotrichum tanaceti]